MDEWNWTHHGGSGLVDRVRASTVSTAKAEAETLAFLQRFAEPGRHRSVAIPFIKIVVSFADTCRPSRPSFIIA